MDGFYGCDGLEGKGVERWVHNKIMSGIWRRREARVVGWSRS